MMLMEKNNTNRRRAETERQERGNLCLYPCTDFSVLLTTLTQHVFVVSTRSYDVFGGLKKANKNKNYTITDIKLTLLG